MNGLALVALALLLIAATTNGTSLPEAKSLHRTDPLPEVGLDVEDYIAYKGYPYETHEVQTKDGYILSVHRIPYGLKDSTQGNRPVVLMVPGLLCSSSCFIINDVDKSLGFLLADRGYDVWIGNPRGTTHSRKHISYDPDNDKEDFWNFSFHEIGNYDLPAMIDYVLETAGQEELYYIGHSQGTTSFFAFASTQPEYNDKIKLMVALAPVAFMSNIPHPLLQSLASNSAFLQWLAETINFYEILPHWEWLTPMAQELCNDDSDMQDFCASVLFYIAGENIDQLNKTMLPIIASTLPAGASVKQFIHYAQGITSGEFRQFSYGALINLIKYGSFTPPSYDLSKINAPVALFYGNNDLLSNATDVLELAENLPNVVHLHFVENDLFSHLDFLWAIDINELINKYVIDLLGKY